MQPLCATRLRLNYRNASKPIRPTPNSATFMRPIITHIFHNHAKTVNLVIFFRCFLSN